MAKIKVLITGEELKEKEEMVKIIKNFKRSEKVKLKGFLEGLSFAKEI